MLDIKINNIPTNDNDVKGTEFFSHHLKISNKYIFAI